MAYELKEGQGSLFVNENRNDHQPNYTGRISIMSCTYNIDAWENSENNLLQLNLNINRNTKGRGTLLKNDTQNDRQPNYKGKIVIDSITYEVAAWVKTSQNGNQYLNLKAEVHKANEAPQYYESPLSACDSQTPHSTEYMKEISKKIVDHMKDFSPIIQNETWKISEDSVIKWGKQFGDDKIFVLTETLNLISKIYLSKAKAQEILETLVMTYLKEFNNNWEEMCKKVSFLMLQSSEKKSQYILLQMVKEIILQKGNLDILDVNKFKEKDKTVFVYLDDVLASGKTYRENLIKWLKDKDRLQKLINDEIRLDTFFFCSHSVQQNDAFWTIACKSSAIDRKKISDKIKNRFTCFHIIENGKKAGNNTYDYSNCKLNCIFPKQTQYTKEAIDSDAKRFDSSQSSYNGVKFRPNELPSQEDLFSTPEAREKFEAIIFQKSLEILKSYPESNPNNYPEGGPKNQYFKPLGRTNKTDKSFGLGTLFITWRNIPNNCPLAFWCVGNDGTWSPLCRRNNT